VQGEVESTLEHFLNARNENKDTGIEAALDAFAKRFLYLLISVDELGKLHYFKKGNDKMILFHPYFISLVTGIFDNLAIYTYDNHTYKIPF
jgi:hypothetical protein